MYIVVEVTLNRAEYGSQRSDQPENVNFEQVLKPFRKWEMIWKHPNSFKTVRKMGNDLERSGQIIMFFCYMRKKYLDEPKNFRVAMLPCFPGFLASGCCTSEQKGKWMEWSGWMDGYPLDCYDY